MKDQNHDHLGHCLVMVMVEFIVENSGDHGHVHGHKYDHGHCRGQGLGHGYEHDHGQGHS